MSNRAISEHAYLVAYELKKICGDLPETTAFKSYAAKHERKSQLLIYQLTRGQLPPLDAQRNVRGYPGIVNDFQSCPKRCLLMLLARVGARTNSTTRAATTRGVVNFRARVLAYVQYAPRVCTLVLFMLISIEMYHNVACAEGGHTSRCSRNSWCCQFSLQHGLAASVSIVLGKVECC